MLGSKQGGRGGNGFLNRGSGVRISPGLPVICIWFQCDSGTRDPFRTSKFGVCRRAGVVATNRRGHSSAVVLPDAGAGGASNRPRWRALHAAANCPLNGLLDEFLGEVPTGRPECPNFGHLSSNIGNFRPRLRAICVRLCTFGGARERHAPYRLPVQCDSRHVRAFPNRIAHLTVVNRLKRSRGLRPFANWSQHMGVHGGA
jgi:hypothetical protein